jgi:hypothetical protein
VDNRKERSPNHRENYPLKTAPFLQYSMTWYDEPMCGLVFATVEYAVSYFFHFIPKLGNNYLSTKNASSPYLSVGRAKSYSAEMSPIQCILLMAA